MDQVEPHSRELLPRIDLETAGQTCGRTELTMIVHAYTAYVIAPDAAGRSQVIETQDFNCFTEWVDSYAEKAASAGYDEHLLIDGLAVTQYRIEVPADVEAAHRAGDTDAIAAFVDGLEWHDNWSGVEVVRRNAPAGALEAASIARAAERAATA
jgi:hypothetical protein